MGWGEREAAFGSLRIVGRMGNIVEQNAAVCHLYVRLLDIIYLIDNCHIRCLSSMGYAVDLRIEKTYRALIVAFTRLLEEHRYEEITVAMLCEEAMIRRTTFYKHFADKAAFFAFFVDSLHFELVKRSAAAGEADEPRDPKAEERTIFQTLVDFLLEHESLMDNLFNSSMVGTMALVICKKTAQGIRERYGSTLGKTAGDAEFAAASEFAAGGIIRLLQVWWASPDRRSSEAEFVEAANQLVARSLGM